MSLKIVWPAPLAPVPRVPTETYCSPFCVKKSRSVCGLPVGKLAWNSHLAPSPPLCATSEGGPCWTKAGAGWSRCAAASTTLVAPETLAVNVPAPATIADGPRLWTVRLTVSVLLGVAAFWYCGVVGGGSASPRSDAKSPPNVRHANASNFV